MFIGIEEKGRIKFTVHGLPSFTRAPGETPILKIESLIGNEFCYDAMLFPKSKDTLIVKVPDSLAEKTIEATQLDQVGELGFPLEKILPKLRELKLVLGEDPRLSVAEVFGVKALHEVLGLLRYSRWILKYAAAGEIAYLHLREIYDEVMRLIQYLPGVPSSPLDVVYAEYEPQSIFGTRIIRLLENSRADIEVELRQALNNPNLRLIVETAESFDLDLAQQGVLAWDVHYGEMWGPFIDKTT